jgi:hypothetical protein
MLNFARQNFLSNLDTAWLDFNQDDSPLPIEEDADEAQIFVPYFLFDWDPSDARAADHQSQSTRLPSGRASV